MKVSTFCHHVFGWFDLPRWTARDYAHSPGAIEAAALLILQSGE